MGKNLGPGKTQILTQTAAGADRTKRHGAECACPVPLFFSLPYIALPMTVPMVSAAFRFISFAAWV